MSHVCVILILLLLAVCGCVFCLDAWDYVLCSEWQPDTRICYEWWCGWLDLAASAVSNSNDGFYFSVLSIMLHVVSYIFFCLPFCLRSLLSCSRSFFSLFCCSVNSFHNTRYTPQPHWVVLPCSLSLPMPSMLILILMPPPPSPPLLPLWLTLFLSLSIDQPKRQKVSQQATIKFVILPKHFFPTPGVLFLLLLSNAIVSIASPAKVSKKSRSKCSRTLYYKRDDVTTASSFFPKGDPLVGNNRCVFAALFGQEICVGDQFIVSPYPLYVDKELTKLGGRLTSITTIVDGNRLQVLTTGSIFLDDNKGEITFAGYGTN